MYLKHSLSDRLVIFKSRCFPYKSVTNSKYLRYEAIIGIGGNVGDVKRRFNHLLIVIKRHVKVELLETSLILKNPPFGYKEQDDFFNSIIVLKTSMEPKIFLDYLMRLEKRFARKRSFENAPRTLDLDIIFFDDRIINSKKLTVPHPHWFKRESVVIPLSGIRV
ncbi:2-amino-4-hydroxy-6-hydroxymethyldihydropteridine diphosphokinase [Sulfurimonas aquatica]|uniref:2-amino-4-hydroxy-6-hydroxymethyldihydropteridine pyrophosphokinase n=1 Tax=Sulfurimonas aquatica TaxID=2672570 RepID=A0A975GCH3_9BACT|nr:2-amino-4-hydroxy-6-hydroxymethyldihydropteridine diphosphokinase [Sulfurimonas aquatica]QSZ41303.1 2-amino-4-hydroxy-6-hydroxymethyldihydropteridine diphosphokinase [Sulfurimonas aquatica]